MPTITLTPYQQIAFDALQTFAGDRATGHAMAVLEGFAGTGKTTIVSELMRALCAGFGGLKVAVMAPTNKAVGVIREKINDGDLGIEFGTLHSFLGLRMVEYEDGSQKCELLSSPSMHEYDLAVIDECSMVSDELFEAILRSKRNCKVLFVGDPAQLPPVNDGNDSPVFRHLEYKLRLNEVVRQARDNPIIAASIAVRQAIEQGRRITLQDLMSVCPDVRPCAIGVMQGGIKTMVDAIVYETQNGRECRAIAYRNTQVAAINSRVHSALYPECWTPFAVGESVINQSDFKINGIANRIYTSEEFTVVSIEHKLIDSCKRNGYRVELQRDDGSIVKTFISDDDRAVRSEINSLFARFNLLKRQANELIKEGKRKQYDELMLEAKKFSSEASILKNTFAPIRHCYAMTAHKSQGSTFDTVVVDWDDLMYQRSDFEFNRMVYVAMTRASKFLAFVTK